jgi:hypothetical protein
LILHVVAFIFTRITYFIGDKLRSPGFSRQSDGWIRFEAELALSMTYLAILISELGIGFFFETRIVSVKTQASHSDLGPNHRREGTRGESRLLVSWLLAARC